jgi:hypothetical protein
MSHDTEATSSKRKCIFDKSIKQWLISPLWEVPVALSHIFSFTVYARAWWSAFMHPAELSKFFKCTSTSNQSQFLFVMFKLCTNKNHSYKHNEQINSQNIDNSECFGVKFVKNVSRNDFTIIFWKTLIFLYISTKKNPKN